MSTTVPTTERRQHAEHEAEKQTRLAREQTALLAEVKADLAESEDRFLRLMRGAKGYALYMLDARGNVASWNAGAELLEGYTAEEILGKHLSTFYPPSEGERAQSNLQFAAQNGRAEEEGWRVRKDGSSFWASVVLSSIHDQRGMLLGFAKITRDLTERKQWEEQLHQSQKMEAIGNLAAGVAHDFNNILSIILSYSELLALDLPPEDPMRADLGEISAAGLLAVTLTRRLLAFGRQQVLKPRVVDLSKVVSGMESMLRRLIGEDVEMRTNFAPECGKVLVDAGQMEQVLMNLAVNARDAMAGAGTLTIEAREVELDSAYAAEHVGVAAGPHVLLSVSDTGTGMDAATQARMFEPFFTTKDPGKGTGLGLATVFGIVKQSCGSIEVSSVLGRGTTINVYLPMVDQAAIITAPRSATSLHEIARFGDRSARRRRPGTPRPGTDHPRQIWVQRPGCAERWRRILVVRTICESDPPIADRRCHAPHERATARRATAGSSPRYEGALHVRVPG